MRLSADSARSAPPFLGCGVKWPAPPSATRCRITSNALTLDVFGQLVPGDRRDAIGKIGTVIVNI
jgi:hypothetical protein